MIVIICNHPKQSQRYMKENKLLKENCKCCHKPADFLQLISVEISEVRIISSALWVTAFDYVELMRRIR